MMNKKMAYSIIFIMFLAVLFIGGSVAEEETVSKDEDYDTAFYVEDSSNLFIKLAKVLDKCCFFTVDIVITGVSNVFSILLDY